MQDRDLKALRKSAGLSQADLAQQIGFSTPYVGEIERGEKALEDRVWAAALVAARRKRYEEARAEAQAMLDSIRAGFQFTESRGSEPMRDVTADLQEQMRASVEMYDELISALDRV